MTTPPRLRNIGPKSAAWLRQVGLRTREDLAAGQARRLQTRAQPAVRD